MSSVDDLARLLRHADRRYQIAAAKRLGEIGDRRAIGPLIRAAERKTRVPTIAGAPSVQAAAVKALAEIDFDDSRDAILRIAHRLLDRGPNPKAGPYVYLDEDYYGQLLACVEALGTWVDEREAYDLLQSLAQDGLRWRGKIDHGVQVAAAVQLLRQEMRQRGLTDQDHEVRYLVANVTGPGILNSSDWVSPGILGADAVRRSAVHELVLSYGPMIGPFIDTAWRRERNKTPRKHELGVLLVTLREREMMHDHATKAPGHAR